MSVRLRRRTAEREVPVEVRGAGVRGARCEVLVTDARGNHALAVARSLGRQGIRVALADSIRSAKGLFSRHCTERVIYPSPSNGVRRFQSEFCRILERMKPAVVMPMTERTILALSANRDEIGSRV